MIEASITVGYDSGPSVNIPRDMFPPEAVSSIMTPTTYIASSTMNSVGDIMVLS
jgi:hypothetical protein